METKLTERKKYWPAEWHTYNVDNYEFNFKCNYYEVSGSRQASLWGHEVELWLDSNILMTNKISYYNRTWETFQFQSCMQNAVYNYMKLLESKLFAKMRDESNVTRLKASDKEQALANDSWYQTITKLYDLIRNGDKGIITENKEIKTENEDSTEDESNEEDVDMTLISLLDKAVSEVPTVGVEDWGKDDELYFVADTITLVKELKPYEEEIPKFYYENAASDDWSDGIETYLEEYCGVNVDAGNGGNTYNWNASLTHDLNFTTYEDNGAFYVRIEIHRSGDVRGNYTTSFLLKFNEEYEFMEAIQEACYECERTLKLNDKTYYIRVNFWSEYVDIYCAETNESWDDVYCSNIETMEEIIMNKEESKKVEAKEPTNENIAETFKNYNAFKANFGEIIIKKSPYDKNYYIFRPDRPGDNDYIHYASTRDYIEGWLYGAVQANNKVIAPSSDVKVTESFAENSGYSSELCQLFITLINVERHFDEIAEYATDDAMYEFITDKLKENFPDEKDLFTAIIVDGAYTNYPIEEIPNLFADMKVELPDKEYIALLCEDYGYDFNDMCNRLGI